VQIVDKCTVVNAVIVALRRLASEVHLNVLKILRISRNDMDLAHSPRHQLSYLPLSECRDGHGSVGSTDVDRHIH
jgi:hypothetical protein